MNPMVNVSLVVLVLCKWQGISVVFFFFFKEGGGLIVKVMPQMLQSGQPMSIERQSRLQHSQTFVPSPNKQVCPRSGEVKTAQRRSL